MARRRGVATLTEAEVEALSPSAAAASRLLKSGMTLTQVQPMDFWSGVVLIIASILMVYLHCRIRTWDSDSKPNGYIVLCRTSHIEESPIQIPILTANYRNEIGIQVHTWVRLCKCKWAIRASLDPGDNSALDYFCDTANEIGVPLLSFFLRFIRSTCKHLKHCLLRKKKTRN